MPKNSFPAWLTVKVEKKRGRDKEKGDMRKNNIFLYKHKVSLHYSLGWHNRTEMRPFHTSSAEVHVSQVLYTENKDMPSFTIYSPLKDEICRQKIEGDKGTRKHKYS